MFFVLSGYFIVAQIGRPDANVLTYLGRRLIRIYPALIVVLASCLAVGWFLQLPSDYMRLGQNSIIGLGGMTNVFPPLSAGYFAARADTHPLLHLWSLSVEIQIYFAAALILPIMTRFISARGLMIIIFAVSLAWLELGLRPQGANGFYDPSARAWQFALGGFVATLGHCKSKHIANLLTLILFAIAVSPVSPLSEANGLILSVVTALAILTLRGSSSAALSSPPLASLGRISFSLYLWHWPILVIWTGFDLTGVTVFEKLGLISLSLCLSVLTWILIEKPFLARGNSQIKAGLVAGGTFLVLAMSGSLILGKGLPERLPQEAQNILTQVRPAHDMMNTCHGFVGTHLPAERACRHNENHAPIQSAVLGDSHAMVLSGGLARTGFPFVEYTYSGCAPTTDLYPETHGPQCATWVEDVLTRIESDPAIETVFVAARWAFYTQPRFDNGRGGHDVHPDTVMRDVKTGRAASDFRVNQSMVRTISRLQESGRRVVVYYPGPVFGWDIENTLTRSAWWSRPIDTTISRQTIETRQLAIRRALDRLPKAGVIRYDPLPRFCDARTCRPASSDGTILLDDQDHLSRDGADLIAKDVLRLLNDHLKKEAQ